MTTREKKLPAGTVWAPTEYTVADVSAIQAMERGDATPDQQKRALLWIVNMASAYYDMSYRPTGLGDTSFAEGKRFVGAQIVKLTKLNISKLKDKE